MSGSHVESWGRFARKRQHGVELHWADALPLAHGATVLPYGQGRSYGDVAQNTGGILLCTRRLDRFISFDPHRGILRAEAGVLLSSALQLAGARGWTLPVVPGTKRISLGGAVANDVHGKNHHRAGTFGHHVRCFELVRSDGSTLLCSPEQNAEWFAATIGGLGLTGLVSWVEMQLSRAGGRWVDVETLPIGSVGEFIALTHASDVTHEFTVGWFDCFSARKGRFRGLFTRGNQVGDPAEGGGAVEPIANVSAFPPFCLLHPSLARAFNRLYYRAGARRFGKAQRVPLDRFLFPLDRIGHWNRLYGPAGFLQLQCVIPHEKAAAGVAELLDVIAASGEGSFLGVIKQFGARPSIGVLSFPRPGLTVALDFPYRGATTLELFRKMHAVVRSFEGRLYAAKDACMTPADFDAGYPHWRRMTPYLDPGFGSDFWHRVTPTETMQ